MRTLAYSSEDSKKDLMQKLEKSGWKKVGETKHGKEIFENVWRHKTLVVDFYRDYGVVDNREKYQGFRLKFYSLERQKFPEAFKSQVTDSEAKKIICKLARHFKLGNPKRWIRFYGNSQSGSSGWSIRLSHNPSIGLICHELAHQKHKRHDKKLMSLIGRMIRYCKKKGWIKE